MALSKFKNNALRQLGIRGQSFLAFAILTIFTLLASIVGWVSYNHIEQELDQVVQVNIPSLKLMEGLNNLGASVSSKAPALYTAKDKKTQEIIWKELNENIDAMIQLLSPEPTLSVDEKSSLSIISQIKTLRTPLKSLNENITRKLNVEGEKHTFSRKLRWNTSSFFSDVDALILEAQKEWYKAPDPEPDKTYTAQNLESVSYTHLTLPTKRIV